MRLGFLLLLFLFPTIKLVGQVESDSVKKTWYEQRASQLLEAGTDKEVLVEIASKRGEAIREAPSIVSVITREEINAYGARDLADILRMVPGFDLAVDVNGLFSIGVRGAWAHEGKALLMINGVGINELAFGNLNFFGSYPATMIERIEIIRGPGSVLYGGFAEVAVVNIITSTGGALRGLKLNADGGVLGSGEFSGNIGIDYGLRTDAVDVSISAGIGSNPQSTRTYQPFVGSISSIDLDNENAFRRFYYLVTTCQSKYLTAKYSRTSFTFSAQQTGIIRPKVNGIYGEKRNNTVDALHLDYKLKVGEHTYIQPIAEYIFSNVISTTVNPSVSQQGRWRSPSVLMNKGRFEVNANHKDRLLVGGGYIRDHINALSDTGLPGLKLSNNPSDTAQHKSINSFYGYFQYTSEWKNWDFTLGGRYERTSFGNAFLPRASAVYVKDKWHLKLLYGRSFRIPMPFQAYTRAWGDGDRTTLVPELATTIELESGYELNEDWNLTANLFYLNIQKPIVFIVESYRNFGQLLSTGIETEVRGKFEHFSIFSNAAYYLPLSKTSRDFLSDDGANFLGFSPLKVNAGFSWKIKKWAISPSLTYLSKRDGVSAAFARGDTNGQFESVTYKRLLLSQIRIGATNISPNLAIHATLYNAFNADYQLIQPYYDNHAPIPVNDRHLVIGLTWKH